MDTLQYGRTTYEVETLKPGEGAASKHIAYRLTGPRGAKYLLMRNANHLNQMYAINERGFTRSTPFTWVLEEAPGMLRIIS